MTKVAGIVVSVMGKPRASVVIIDGPFTAPTVIEVFDLTTTETDTAGQAQDLSANLRNRLRGTTPDRVLVRRADFPPRPSNKEGPRLRLIIEGAIAAAAKEIVTYTVLLTGRDAAARTSMTKDDLNGLAATLVGPKERQAGAAALAALEG